MCDNPIKVGGDAYIYHGQSRSQVSGTKPLNIDRYQGQSRSTSTGIRVLLCSDSQKENENKKSNTPPLPLKIYPLDPSQCAQLICR